MKNRILTTAAIATLAVASIATCTPAGLLTAKASSPVSGPKAVVMESEVRSSHISRTVKPMGEKVDLSNLEDGTYNVRLAKKNLVKEDGKLVIKNAKLYREDVFAKSDVKGIAAGDKIVVGGKKITVKSVKTNKYGDILINGGFEEDGVTLSLDKEVKGYVSVSYDDARDYTKLGKTDLTISKDVKYNDSSDLDKKVTANYSKLEKKMDDSSIDYNERNTTVTVKDGSVVEINRVFIP